MSPEDTRQLAMDEMDDRPGYLPQAVRDAYHENRSRPVRGDGESCPKCGSQALVYAEGRKTCVGCGWSVETAAAGRRPPRGLTREGHRRQRRRRVR